MREAASSLPASRFCFCLWVLSCSSTRGVPNKDALSKFLIREGFVVRFQDNQESYPLAERPKMGQDCRKAFI